MRTAAHDGDPEADWGDNFPAIEASTLFECNSTVGGRYSSICVYADLVVLEGPGLPNGRVDLRPAQITGWWMHDDGDRLTVTLDSGVLHDADLPVWFAGAIRTALVAVLGHPTAAVAT